MEIEGAKAVVDHVALPSAIENELRHRTRVRSSHYSTFIEGNRLTLREAVEVIEGLVPDPPALASSERVRKKYYLLLSSGRPALRDHLN